jgi:hypothetical protein
MTAKKKTIQKKAAKKAAPAKVKTAQKKAAVSVAKKSAAPKKPPIKKASPAVKARVSEKNQLVKDLVAGMGNLSVDQLKKMKNSMKVSSINEQIEELNQHRIKTLSPYAQTGSYNYPMDKNTIDVQEGEDGSFFIIVINNFRNFFSRAELKKIVTVCQGAENETEACRRLFGWFARERSDVIKNTKIIDDRDQALATIYNFLIEHYSVKE